MIHPVLNNIFETLPLQTVITSFDAYASQELAKLHTNMETYTSRIESLTYSLTEKDNYIKALEQTNKSLKLANESLKNTIQSLEDEKKAFTKVSHIIAMEKENARLKNELDALQARLSRQVDVVSNTSAPTSDSTITTVEDIHNFTHETPKSEMLPTKENEQDACDEANDDAALTVYEKKIKGKVYYISSTDNTIYERTEDGEIGRRLGVLQKQNEKMRPIWDS